MASVDDKEDLLLSCRYGDLDDVQRFVGTYGSDSLDDVKDDNGNTVLHMACGNGHEDILDYILPLVSPSLLAVANHSGSTPLHWAALNSHLSTVKKLVLFPHGPGAALIDCKNVAGRSPLGEAELAGWEEGAQWLVGQMALDDGDRGVASKEEDADGEELEQEVGEVEVEIQDAEGRIAKMSLGQTQNKISPVETPGEPH
ncbi:cytoplasmic protein [Gautieria morchelliformis]|nr:cytoplasmic protein [Gautieria morchelliformis]